MSLLPREVSFEQAWPELQAALEQILRGHKVGNLSLSRLHHQVYVIVTSPSRSLVPDLYAAVGGLLRLFAQSQVK